MTITEMTISNAIYISWKTATDFLAEGDFDMADYSWKTIAIRLEGMQDLLLWSPDSLEETEELRDYCETLRQIALIHARTAVYSGD